MASIESKQHTLTGSRKGLQILDPFLLAIWYTYSEALSTQIIGSGAEDPSDFGMSLILWVMLDPLLQRGSDAVGTSNLRRSK